MALEDNHNWTDGLGLKELADDVLYEVDVTLKNLPYDRKYKPSKLLPALNWIERQTHTRTNHAQMLVGLREGLFLREFVRRTFSGRVLEIGTFTGYSLACLADGSRSCTAGGVASQPFWDQQFRAERSVDVYVDAIEINKELDYIIYEGLERAGVDSLVKVFFGDAVELLANSGIAEQYDMVFIDADKRQYPQYYELVFPLVRPGGYILADNVSWYGKAKEAEILAGQDDAAKQPSGRGSAGGKQKKTAGIVEFNRMVEEDPRVESRFVEIRDGLYLIRKKVF